MFNMRKIILDFKVIRGVVQTQLIGSAECRSQMFLPPCFRAACAPSFQSFIGLNIASESIKSYLRGPSFRTKFDGSLTVPTPTLEGSRAFGPWQTVV